MIDMIKLSIITPYYKKFEYIKELANALEPQLNSMVEWIIIDDGCHEKRLDSFKANVIHLEENSGGASVPRNVGLDNAKGGIIAFIDSDDLVSGNYIRKITEKIDMSSFDICYMNWKHIGKTDDIVIINDEPMWWNTCVWDCLYTKEAIGNIRFDPKLRTHEDEEFNKFVRKGKKEHIREILYCYRDGVQNSLTQEKIKYNDKFI